jgi:hypothetical protein
LSEFWPKFPKNVQKLAKISPFLCAFFHVSTRPLYSPSIGGPPGCKFGPPQKIPKFPDLLAYTDIFTPKNRPFLAIFWQNLTKNPEIFRKFSRNFFPENLEKWPKKPPKIGS